MIFFWLFIPTLCLSYTLVIIPDSQYYSAYYPELLSEQMDWCCTCQQKLDIVYITHVGDIVEHGNVNPQEWKNAYYPMSRVLNNSICQLNIGFTPGNHDVTLADSDPIDNYQEFLGNLAQWNFKESYPPNTNLNTYSLVDTPQGSKLLFLSILSDVTTTIEGTYEWADSILKTYPNRDAFISSHFILSDCDNYMDDHIY